MNILYISCSIPGRIFCLKKAGETGGKEDTMRTIIRNIRSRFAKKDEPDVIDVRNELIQVMEMMNKISTEAVLAFDLAQDAYLKIEGDE